MFMDMLMVGYVKAVTFLPAPRNNPTGGGENANPSKFTEPAELVKNIQTWVAPLLFLVIGGIALSFLFKRQMTQFFQFAAIAVLVIVFWYAGEPIIGGIAGKIGDWTSGQA